jgi:putative glutamine amidotransferase
MQIFSRPKGNFEVTKPKPLIGLTSSRMPHTAIGSVVGTNEPYTRSIENAGGIPILIPPHLTNEEIDLLLSRLDGILFTGGYDIDPRVYGNPQHPKAKGIDTGRDRVEIHIVRSVIISGKPFLGICRGLQVVNVTLGGSLYEDLAEQFPSQIIHDNHGRARDYLAHEVKIEARSRLIAIIGADKLAVNSLHHQGVRRIASRLIPSATSDDGLVEACELPDHPFGLAVQWHPEELQKHSEMRRLLETFVQSCC